ncbi:2-aminoadipate transaminase, partial [Fusarium albosuccineum]
PAGKGKAALSSCAYLTSVGYENALQDSRWDDSYKYIRYPDKGAWSVRFTAWYTGGLLHRNKGSDVANAKAAIENILKCQFTEDYDSAWYGTFKLSPDEPYPTADSPLYPPKIYDTYDPNWREFVGTQLIQVVEEFEDLLGQSLVSQIEDALEVAAIGAMRRNGTFLDGDNLTIAYANPALMRAWFVGWIGHRIGNKEFVDFADKQGDLILELFKSTGDDVFSEYNSPTYYGMDAWALAGSIKYGPKNATMTRNAEFMLTELWKDIAEHWNPFLGNLVGPYDRAYTRDLTSHSSVVSLFWWSLFGHEYGPQIYEGNSDLLFDVAQGSSLALIMDTTANFISDKTARALKAKGPWKGDRFTKKSIPDKLGKNAPVRIATSWMSAPLMIGGEQVEEDVNRGDQFVPAIVHWLEIRNTSLYPTSPSSRYTPLHRRLMLLLDPTV